MTLMIMMIVTTLQWRCGDKMIGNNYGDDDGHDSDDDDSDDVVVVVVVTAVVDVSLVAVLQKCPSGSSCQVINRRPRCVTTGSLFIPRSSETPSLCLHVCTLCLHVCDLSLSVCTLCLYSACLYSVSACLYSLSACLYYVCLSARRSPCLFWNCCWFSVVASLTLVVRQCFSILLVLLLLVIFPASSPLAYELISCTVLTYTWVLVYLKCMCMCSISTISPPWTTVRCKKTMCVLNYPRKL